MKFVKLTILFLVISATIAWAQLDRVNLSADYSIALSERLDVNNSTSLGAIVGIRYKLSDKMGITINSGFQQYSFTQDSALAQWDWRYWDYYYQFVETTLTEDEYSAVLSPFQKMDVIPLYVTLDYNLVLSNDLTLKPAIGGGVMFFTRRFYVTEDWARDFESINYRFAYSFRNIGPEKSGNPLFVTLGVDLDYEFSEDYFLNVAINYKHVLNTGEKFGYSLFTFENSLSLNIGIGFGY